MRSLFLSLILAAQFISPFALSAENRSPDKAADLQEEPPLPPREGPGRGRRLPPEAPPGAKKPEPPPAAKPAPSPSPTPVNPPPVDRDNGRRPSLPPQRPAPTPPPPPVDRDNGRRPSLPPQRPAPAPFPPPPLPQPPVDRDNGRRPPLPPQRPPVVTPRPPISQPPGGFERIPPLPPQVRPGEPWSPPSHREPIVRRPGDGRLPGGEFERRWRDSERERRRREIGEERLVRDRRDLERLRRGYQGYERNEYRRLVGQREFDRNQDLNGYLRWKSEQRRRIAGYQDQWRREFSQHRRPLPGQRRDFMNQGFWNEHYTYWWYYSHRPLPPEFSIWIIPPFVPFPDNNTYWDQDDLYQIAAVIENMSFDVYRAATEEAWDYRDTYKKELLASLYDLVEAAGIFQNAVARNDRQVVSSTLRELFYLQDVVNELEKTLLCSEYSDYVKDNYKQIKYYVDQAIWQYRIGNDWTSPDFGDFNRPVEMDPRAIDSDEILTCQSYSFRWDRPHDQYIWQVSNRDNRTFSDRLEISVLNKANEVGRSGVASVSHLVVYYQDGTSTDLLREFELRPDRHAFDRGRLTFKDNRDSVELPIDNRRSVSRIEIRADSWISQDVRARLAISLHRDNR